MTLDREGLRRRNADALRLAKASPEAFATFAVGPGWRSLIERLGTWPLPPEVRGEFHSARRRDGATLTAAEAAEADRWDALTDEGRAAKRAAGERAADEAASAEWWALLAREQAHSWRAQDTGTRLLASSRDALEKLIGYLEQLPERSDSITGYTLLTALVAEWPQPVKPDNHRNAILPGSWRDARRGQSTLPFVLDRATPLGPVGKEPEQADLPGLERPAGVVPPVPWLSLYDLTGSGPVQTRGRGAPMAQRLFVEVLTSVQREDREWTAAPPIALRDLFAWLWPRYYDPEADRMRGGYDRSKHLKPLQRALVELDNMRLWLDGAYRRLIRVDDLPGAGTPLDWQVRFHVRHLPGSDHGPAIDRARMRRWGLESAPAWRSAIRLAYLWDAAKGRNNGARVYATRPVVARGDGGVLLGADGQPLRDRRGAIVADWSDRRAVVLGADGKPAGATNPPAWERNPAADRVPVLGPDDLVRLAYADSRDLKPASRRRRLSSARRALERMEAAGEVVVEREAGGGFRVLEKRPPRVRP